MIIYRAILYSFFNDTELSPLFTEILNKCFFYFILISKKTLLCGWYLPNSNSNNNIISFDNNNKNNNHGPTDHYNIELYR